MYLCVNGIFCLFLRCFYWNLEIFRQCGIFWRKCPDSVVFFWEMFRQRGIFGGKCSDSVVFVGGNVPTVWYFWGEMFRQCDIFWGEMFRQCGIFWGKYSDSGIFGGKFSDIVVFWGGNVPTLWYFLLFILLFAQNKIRFIVDVFVRSRLIII